MFLWWENRVFCQSIFKIIRDCPKTNIFVVFNLFYYFHRIDLGTYIIIYRITQTGIDTSQHLKNVILAKSWNKREKKRVQW